MVFCKFWCIERQNQTRIGEMVAISKLWFCRFSTKSAHFSWFFNFLDSDLVYVWCCQSRNFWSTEILHPLKHPTHQGQFKNGFGLFVRPMVWYNTSLKNDWYYFLGDGGGIIPSIKLIFSFFAMVAEVFPNRVCC